mgnify:CR=1 FL=1
MAKGMHDLIESLLQNQGIELESGTLMLEAQITFHDGQAVAGTIKRGPVEGSYNILTPIRDKTTGAPVGLIDVYFFPDHVRHIDIPRPMAKPAIVTPRGMNNGNLILP